MIDTLATSPSTAEQLWPIVVAGSFGLTGGVAGVLAGKSLERRHGHAAWRHDKQLSAYSDLLEKSHLFWAVATTIYQRPSLVHEKVDELNHAKLAFHRSLTRIAILGPERTYELGGKLGEAIEAISAHVTNLPFDNSKSLSETPLGKALQDADDRYVASAKKALEIPD